MAIPFLNNIDLVKNQLLNAVFQNLAVAPSNPVEGQFYYNTTDKKMFYYNGTAWVDTTYLLPIASATVLGGVKVGSGLAIDGNGVLSATGTDTEIINNLTSDRTDAALAAAQGKVLKGLIDTIQSTIDGLGTAATKNVGTASGNIPVLDSNGKLNTSVLPALAITEVFTVASQSAMTSLTAQQGDVAVRTDVNKTFILSKEPAATAANWIELQFPISVTSVNGKTGIITLTGEDINATVGSVTKSVQSFLADLGEIDLKVQENTTTITTIEGNVTNITNTQAQAEGKNIHIEDSAEEPFVDVELYGESTQNGTPTPDSPIEIENIEGKNKFKNNYEAGYTTTNNGVTFTVNKDKSITANGTATDTVTFIFATNIELKKGTYTVSGITSGSINTYNMTISSLTSIYNGARTHTINADTTYVNAFIRVNSGVTVDNITFYPMIEKGTVATPYVPYNSLEIKNVGENLFNPSNAKDGYVNDNNGQILGVNNITNKNTGYIKIDGGEKYFILSNKLSGNWGAWYDKDKRFISGIALGAVDKGIVTAPNNAYFINFTVSYNNNNPDYANNVMIARSDKEIQYKPYQEQKVTFPLGEEKLMEGSYLADDGVHNVRGQIVFDGSDDENWTANGTNQGYGIVIDNVGGNTVGNVTSSVLCDKLTAVPQNTIYNGSAINGVASLGGTAHKLYVRFDSSITTVALLREKLAESPILIEYELAEPEVVPYTAEQQTAWNKIKALMTYKNITNITSDAYAKIIYMRDNGLDVYETKQNAEKNYTETTKKLAEQKITTDEISSKVSSLETTLENNYSTTEEMNSAITAKVNEIITELLPIKIITGVIPGSSYDDNSKTQTVVIDYPSGFNASNTIVIASMLKPVSTDCTSTYSGRVDVLLYSSGEYANKMEVSFSEAWGLDMYYKIVLMKM